MATYENGGMQEAPELLSDMRVLGVVPTLGRALKGYDAPKPSSGGGKNASSAFFLHKVAAARIMPLLARIPAVVRAEFIRGFAASKALANATAQARLPKEVELVYSAYDVGKDRQLALVEYFGDERPDYLFLPNAHFKVAAFRGRRGRKVGGPRGAARDPWGVVSRMAAYRKRRLEAAAARGRGGIVGAIKNAFGTTRVMRARARGQPSVPSAPGQANAYAGHSTLNRAAARAYLRRLARRPRVASGGVASNTYAGPSTTAVQAASAFLERRRQLDQQRLNAGRRRSTRIRRAMA